MLAWTFAETTSENRSLGSGQSRKIIDAAQLTEQFRHFNVSAQPKPLI